MNVFFFGANDTILKESKYSSRMEASINAINSCNFAVAMSIEVEVFLLSNKRKSSNVITILFCKKNNLICL